MRRVECFGVLEGFVWRRKFCCSLVARIVSDDCDTVKETNDQKVWDGP